MLFDIVETDHVQACSAVGLAGAKLPRRTGRWEVKGGEEDLIVYAIVGVGVAGRMLV